MPSRERADAPGDGLRAGRPPLALTFLVPGAPQWLWDQRGRGGLLASSFATSLAMGLFAWGTRAGLALLAVAFLAHVASAADAIRQWSFPGFGRWAPSASVSAALAVGCYGPLIALGSVVAWPGVVPGGPREGYAVNRLAYRDREPAPGEHVWLGPTGHEPGGRLAVVLARPGDEVEWSGGRLRASGRRGELAPFRPGQAPRSVSFRVPSGQLLIDARTADPLLPRTWELVPRSRVAGRAWAVLYPVWDRRLLN